MVVEEWKVRYDKSYHDLNEIEKTFDIFRNNLLFIDYRNHPKNNNSFTLGINGLSS